jgi:hypothetical protein
MIEESPQTPGETLRANRRSRLFLEIAREAFAQLQLAQFSEPGLGDMQGQSASAITARTTS